MFAPAPTLQAEFPALKAMVARVLASQGRLAEAAALLPIEAPAHGQEPHTMAANRIWLSADVLLALGQPAQARQVLEQGLHDLRQAGATLLPMNGTQMHRALADACEATGDLPAALAALRQSHAFCHTWVGQALQARLQSLHFAAAQTGDLAQQRRHERRQRAVDEAVALFQAPPMPPLRPATTSPVTTPVTPASPQRRDLLAQVTHEVRNPIHGVIWLTSMLMMSDLDERQREYLQLAHGSAKMALELCNDVLDLAKLDAGKLTLRTEPLDLAQLVAECAKVHAAQPQPGLSLSWQCDDALPQRLLGDRLRLQQVLMNLLNNAVKYAPRGHIEVRVRWLAEAAGPDAARVHLSIQDTGPGLPAELLPRLFQEFTQAEDDILPNHGAGLGLALCRRLVRLMGGEIGVDNRPGAGCTFWCRLPLQPAGD